MHKKNKHMPVTKIECSSSDSYITFSIIVAIHTHKTDASDAYYLTLRKSLLALGAINKPVSKTMPPIGQLFAGLTASASILRVSNCVDSLVPLGVAEKYFLFAV